MASSSDCVEQADHFFHSLFPSIDSRLDHHVEELFVVCLAASDDVPELGAEAIEGNSLLPTPALAVVGDHFRFHQLQNERQLGHHL